jgi:alpha-mannosidase
LYHQIHWTSQKIRQRLELIEQQVYQRWDTLPVFRYLKLSGPEVDPPLLSDRGSERCSIPWGSHWGEPDANFALLTRFQVPADWPKDSPIALFLPIGTAGDFSHPEALVYIDAVPFASCDRHHQEIILGKEYTSGKEHILLLHGWTGSLSSGQQRALLMGEGALVQIHQPSRDLLALARVALGVADELSEDNPIQAHLYNALDQALKVLDTREPFGEKFYASVPAALATLRKGVRDSGDPLAVSVTAVGHAHIDVAWLWTLNQTRRKCGRTFHNVLRLMEAFPDFIFTQSQPQLYDFVQESYPALFEAIKARIQDGRWEPIGGMWVEADCNLSGGESLARQFLLGRSYFRRHFGPSAESPVLWLPDVFGYAWNLPQLIKEAGLEYFFTIKIGWSQYNRLPYDSFWWQGLDGTRVLTHFSTTKDRGSAHASTYNANASPGQILGTWTNFQQKDWGPVGQTPPLLMSFGYGDGGGGPTREMLENIRELNSFPGAPRTQAGKVLDFFQRLELETGTRLPTWNGELYLEFHRGTYTTQARNKRANRKSEFLLHDAEFLASVAATLDPNYRYPHQDLQEAWKLVCLNQFHDIIPGSSIGAVYAESQAQYARVQKLGEQVLDKAVKSLAQVSGADLLLINPTSFSRRDLAFCPDLLVPEMGFQSPDGLPLPVQRVDGGLLLDPGQVAPYSIIPLNRHPRARSAFKSELSASPELLENDFLRIVFDQTGDIVEIYDKEHNRQVLPAGAIANQFQAFEDRPRTPDAWEIDIYYDDKMWTAEAAETIRVVENGPLRATLEVKRRILNSDIKQRISLAHNSRRLDFDTNINWQERHIMLKTAFPVEVLSPVATYEIQWGNVQRPTHRNTSWDWARFETCAQKWVDLSEGGYGVSLLNDCKYGHDILDNVIRLTLLRSPTYPDPTADRGLHSFVYSLLPHKDRWNLQTVAQAYALNDPLIVRAGTGPGKRPEEEEQATLCRGSSFVKVDLPNVVIETIKVAEDDRGVIVRLYECLQIRDTLTLTTGFPLISAWRTNLLEENQEALTCCEDSVTIPIKPYQILTLRLVPSNM